MLEATDQFNEYDGELKDGFYVVDDIRYYDKILHALCNDDDNCYRGNTLKYLRDHGCMNNVIKKLIPRKQLDKNFFVSFVDYITDTIKSDVKRLINPFIGMLGQKHFDSVNIHKVCNRAQCLGWNYKYMDYRQNRKIVQIEGMKDLYHFFCFNDTKLSENARPIRQQILENRSILMYEHIKNMVLNMTRSERSKQMQYIIKLKKIFQLFQRKIEK